MVLAYTKTVTGLPALLIILAVIGFFIWIGMRIGRRGRR
jgi:flagellar biogenesis protein FliO